jgi:hypothetical protein
MGPGRQTLSSRPLRRALAAGLALLIFTLGLFSVSPVLHKRLHHHGAAAPAEGCAIVLFANGVSVPVAVTAPLPPVSDWQSPPAVGSIEIFLDSPRYLLQPERGPPVA